MFYEPSKQDHGLPHSPLNACVVPRPVGWISTLSKEGVLNLAPFSFFNLVSGNPAIVMFSASSRPDGSNKDSQVNAEEAGEFVFNLATWELREPMNLTASIEEPNFDELHAVGLTTAPSRMIKTPRVSESPIQLECRYQQTVHLPGRSTGHHSSLILGEVVGVHINDEFIIDGMVDTAKMKPLARLGYHQYSTIENTFWMPLLSADELRESGISV